MGRGKPFARSIKNLVDAGVMPRPIWLSTVEATKPKFQPRYVKKVPSIFYPEDRLRSIFLIRNPNARRIPVNLHAEKVDDRHVADRFVSLQLKFMQQDGLSERDAYDVAQNLISQIPKQSQDYDPALHGPLADESIQNEASKLFLASLKDSQRDQIIHKAYVKQSDSQRK